MCENCGKNLDFCWVDLASSPWHIQYVRGRYQFECIAYKTEEHSFCYPLFGCTTWHERGVKCLPFFNHFWPKAELVEQNTWRKVNVVKPQVKNLQGALVCMLMTFYLWKLRAGYWLQLNKTNGSGTEIIPLVCFVRPLFGAHLPKWSSRFFFWSQVNTTMKPLSLTRVCVVSAGPPPMQA